MPSEKAALTSTDQERLPVTPELPSCPLCGTRACSLPTGEKAPPGFCPMLQEPSTLKEVEARATTDPALRRMAQASARTEAFGYGRMTRVEEVMDFARRLDATRLGIAHCVGLTQEARLARSVFIANGFEVAAVCCKVGAVPKEAVGLSDAEKVRPGNHEVLCNPVAQAAVLEAAGTHLNVVAGLCVGHDSLFFAHSKAPATVLIAKDRVTGHNPAAALYTSRSYYSRLLPDGR